MIAAKNEGTGATQTRHCELCRRASPLLTRHHLIPRARHDKKRVKRHYSKSDMRERIIVLCKACHKQIHAVLSEKELSEKYNTAGLLLQHPDIRRFVQWIETKPVEFTPRTVRKGR